MSPPPDLEDLSPGDLKALVIALVAKVTTLEATVAAQRDEIARLKNVPSRPTFKPSGMENAIQAKPADEVGKLQPGGGKKTARREVHEDRVIKATVPSGSRFKGYADFVVQDLVFRPLVVRYRRERWLTPDGLKQSPPLSRLASMVILGRRCAVLCWLSIIKDRSLSGGWRRNCAPLGLTSRTGR